MNVKRSVFLSPRLYNRAWPSRLGFVQDVRITAKYAPYDIFHLDNSLVNATIP